MKKETEQTQARKEGKKERIALMLAKLVKPQPRPIRNWFEDPVSS
jgi:hypothetical protein